MGILLSLTDRMPPAWIRGAGVRGRSRWLKAMTDWLPDLIRNREGVIQKGLGRGLRFHGANSAVGFLLGTHDPEVQFVLGQLLRPGMTCFDIGANVGFTAVLAARQVGPHGCVICFEPLQASATQIRHNAMLNGFAHVDVRCTALGALDGEAEFCLSESPTWGRLAQVGATPLPNGMIRVPVRRLDALAADGDLPDPVFIKMDVEGAEADVIAGGKALLRRARPVLVVELHHTYEAVAQALAGLDYVIRPLMRGVSAATDGEFQILAYPRERPEVEELWSEATAGKAVSA